MNRSENGLGTAVSIIVLAVIVAAGILIIPFASVYIGSIMVFGPGRHNILALYAGAALSIAAGVFLLRRMQQYRIEGEPE